MPQLLGLDLHKQYIHGCERDQEGQKERHFRFPNTPQEWSKLIGRLEPDAWVALEVTGGAFEVYDILLPHVGKLVLCNPLEMRRLGSGRHTDRVDAERMVRMLAMDTLPEVWVPPQELREIRRLLHYRERLISTKHRLGNQAQAVVRRYAPQREEATSGKAPDPRWADWMEGADRVIYLSSLAGTRQIEGEIQVIEAQIARQVKDIRDVQLLLTITGVSLIGAAAIWSAIGDPQRFRSPKQVGRYGGLDPSVFQSGEEDRRGHISKNGNKILRSILMEAANSAAIHDTGALRQFYLRKKPQLDHRRAVVALARKLLIVAWRILLTGEPYRAVKPMTLSRKKRHLEKQAVLACDWDEVLQRLIRKDRPVARSPGAA